MRSFVLLALVACSSSPAPSKPQPHPAPPVGETQTADSKLGTSVVITRETLAGDTPKTTTSGNTFIAPAGWQMWVLGEATFLEAPEGTSRIVLIDLPAYKTKDAATARDFAWSYYGKYKKDWPVLTTTPVADRDGWSKITVWDYQTSPNEKREVRVSAMFANDAWTIMISDLTDDVAEKRASQAALIFNRFLPKGYTRETFAGKKAHPLDKARIAQLTKFVEDSMAALGVPGVSFGLVEHGKVVYAGGHGVRELGKPQKVDGDTRYMIASNTKALTTLMLAKLVEAKKLQWDATATSVLPSFKLGDADTTRKVLVKHLICACTGMPRQDYEWIFEFKKLTPDLVLAALGRMQPTSKFGELYQYSNIMAAAAGFLGGHVAFPELALGKAYDEAIRTLVLEPLGMKSTTLDFKAALRGNVATPHAPDIDDKHVVASNDVNLALVPVRPTGGAWSTVKDMLAYVAMELAEGKLPNGKQYIDREALLARRTPQVQVDLDRRYGMGLMIDNKYGTPVIHHGGATLGFHSDMMWLPEHGVGAVVLTNSDAGYQLHAQFRRKLLEVLFDGKPEAAANIETARVRRVEAATALKKQLAQPADPTEVGKLATRYSNETLGDIVVIEQGGKVIFDFGEWKSEVLTRKNPDGTVSFVTIAPGLVGESLTVGTAGGKRTLISREAQHEYVFTER